MTAPTGRAAILAGSCSEATRGQVEARSRPASRRSRSIRARDRRRQGRRRGPGALGDEAAGRQAGADLFERRSRRGRARCRRSSAATRPARMVERELAAIARALVAGRLHAADRRRRRDLGRGRQRARRHRARDRPGDRPRRAVDARARSARDLALALKSGNFGAPDFFLKAWETSWHERETASCASRSARPARSLFDRGLTHGSTGNISVRLDRRRLADDADRLVARHARSGAAVASSMRHGRWSPATRRPRKRSCTRRCTRSGRSAGAVVHLHSTHSVAVSCLHGVDHADCLPPITAYYVMRVGTLPLVPYFPPGDAALAEAVGKLAGRHHAVLLANHGPVVAGSTPGRRDRRHRGAGGDGEAVPAAARRAACARSPPSRSPTSASAFPTDQRILRGAWP